MLWRPLAVPILLTVAFLTAGVPLFLRMPPWCDITLYDLAARAVLTGGVHYRDVFDTNLPGYVWLLAGIRSAIGWSSEALRVVDLFIVAGIVLVLDRFARQGGASVRARWWAAAGVSAFYPFTSEFVHAQRDVWLALPAVLAVYLRVRRAVTGEEAKRTGGAFVAGFLEGVLWAVAVWIKPHIVTVAVPVWLLTARRLACRHERPWRALGADLLGNLAGGGLLGALGVAQLIASGTWPHFWAVMTEWNPTYSQNVFRELPGRVALQLYWFPPWSWFLPLSAVLALSAILDARLWSSRLLDGDSPPGRQVLRDLVVLLLMVPLSPYRLAVIFAGHPFVPAWVWAFGRWTARTFLDATDSDRVRYVRGVLGALYLTWVVQALVVQRGFHYAHVVEVFLMLALWAAHRWCLPVLVLAWVAVTSAVVAVAGPDLLARIDRFERSVGGDEGDRYYFVTHPVLDRERMAWWADCFRDLPPAERRARADALRHLGEFEASVNWTQLGEVADFLRARGVADRQLIAWHDSPHPLYLLLDVEPGLRFMHVNTAADIDPHHTSGRVMAEANANARARYVVADIESMAHYADLDGRAAWWARPADPTAPPLPPRPPRVDHRTDFEFPFDRDPTLPADSPKRYPFDRRPVLFRSKGGTGRYIVFELCQPIRGVFERP